MNENTDDHKKIETPTAYTPESKIKREKVKKGNKNYRRKSGAGEELAIPPRGQSTIDDAERMDAEDAEKARQAEEKEAKENIEKEAIKEKIKRGLADPEKVFNRFEQIDRANPQEAEMWIKIFAKLKPKYTFQYAGSFLHKEYAKEHLMTAATQLPTAAFQFIQEYKSASFSRDVLGTAIKLAPLKAADYYDSLNRSMPIGFVKAELEDALSDLAEDNAEKYLSTLYRLRDKDRFFGGIGQVLTADLKETTMRAIDKVSKTNPGFILGSRGSLSELGVTREKMVSIIYQAAYQAAIIDPIKVLQADEAKVFEGQPYRDDVVRRAKLRIEEKGIS